MPAQRHLQAKALIMPKIIKPPPKEPEYIISNRDVEEIYKYTLKISKELLAKGDSDEHTP